MTEPTADEALDFQHAKFDAAPPAALSCQRCTQPLTGRYFSLNGHGICTSCLEAAGAAQRGSLLKALLLGSAASVLGALAYYGIRTLSGGEQPLATVAVGIAAGFAVRTGAGGSPGASYRLLAIGMAYVAMCSTYVPALLEQFDAAVTPFSVAFTLLWSLRAPVFMATNGDTLAVLIFGFGLWSAWRLSAPHPFVVEGPFTRRTAPPI